MKTITINTPDELLLKWQKIANILDISLEELIVTSVEQRLHHSSETLPVKVEDAKQQNSEIITQNNLVYADFSEMASDREYQQEALAICKEFEKADWEALQLGESEYETR